MIKKYIQNIKKVLPKPVSNFLINTKNAYHRFIYKNIHTNFNIHTIYTGHLNTTYRGVTAIKCPFDYVLYQMIISEIEPDLIIEIGTHKGGGSLYLGDLLNTLGKGVLHTIDIEPVDNKTIINHPRIKLFSEGWEKYDIKEAEGFSKILVIEDGAHTYEHSIGAMKKFAPLVSVGSYLIVEDGIITELGMGEKFNGGPLKAIREFMKDNQTFKIERKWCDFFGKNATFNVDGYLKRIK
jgi:cephalosporin hydroxylase